MKINPPPRPSPGMMKFSPQTITNPVEGGGPTTWGTPLASQVYLYCFQFHFSTFTFLLSHFTFTVSLAKLWKTFSCRLSLFQSLHLHKNRNRLWKKLVFQPNFHFLRWNLICTETFQSLALFLWNLRWSHNVCCPKALHYILVRKLACPTSRNPTI